MELLKAIHQRGVGGIIFLSQNYSLSLKAQMIVSTKSFRELWTLKMVLISSLEKQVTHMKILGDCLLTMQWMKGDYILYNYLLQALFQHIKNLQSTLSHIYFSHMYREHNYESIMLSKEGLVLQERT